MLFLEKIEGQTVKVFLEKSWRKSILTFLIHYKTYTDMCCVQMMRISNASHCHTI
jgi:hypothetical protein